MERLRATARGLPLRSMIAKPWSLLVRRATTVLAVLALLQALLPGWHGLDHVGAHVVAASHVGHACGHHHVDDDELPADPLPADEGNDPDHRDCPLCLSLQAGSHAADLTPLALVLLSAALAGRLASPDAAGISWCATRWTPPARGPPRRV